MCSSFYFSLFNIFKKYHKEMNNNENQYFTILSHLKELSNRLDIHNWATLLMFCKSSRETNLYGEKALKDKFNKMRKHRSIP